MNRCGVSLRGKRPWRWLMGFVAERAPKTGVLGLDLIAAAGSLAVGLVTTPLLGAIADQHLTQLCSVRRSFRAHM